MSFSTQKFQAAAAVFLIVSFLAGTVGLPGANAGIKATPASAAALKLPSYQAKITTDFSRAISLKPGQAKTLEIKMTNLGAKAWTNEGINYLSLMAVTFSKTGDPVKRKSQFRDDSWLEESRVSRLEEKNVASKKDGSFTLTLKAPKKEGEYTENFASVIKGITWLDGSRFSLKIKVINPPQKTGKDQKLVYPTRDETYAATKLIQSDDQVDMVVGEEQQFSVGFKNVGKKPWKQTGPKYVALYTTDPSYHVSPFYNKADIKWSSESEIEMEQEEVKPGEIGYFRFTLKAPTTPGEFEETFRLAADEWTWVKDSELRLPITVKPKALAVAPDINTQDPLKSANPNGTVYKDKTLAALKLIVSASNLVLKPGEVTNFRVGFKNIGPKSWVSTGDRYVSLYTAQPSYRASLFAPALTTTSGWLASNQVKLETPTVNSGEIGYLSFDLKAPTRPGDYKENFRLASEEWSWIQGSDFEIPITVLPDESAVGSPTGGQPGTATAPKTIEPILRVGLFPTREEVKITANGQFEVRQGSNNQLLTTLNAGETAVVSYDFTNKLYHMVTPAVANNSVDYFRFVPLNPAVIMELLNYEKRPAWNLSINYNKFRGVIEARYGATKDRFWIINELGMEDYLKGMAETSNGLPLEFLKSMTVAARTYAFYHYLRATKHKDEFFTIDSYYDQVYRGYSSESRMTDLTVAVDSTRGQVATYNGDIAITPYYSQSDGRTRTWSEVWGGDVPWCVSVPVPQDVGKPLLGHGVGMSARGALLMARDQGLNVESILKYFYKGISLEKWY
ncbi:hypothetical protein HY224_03560 [Candidatus Uhrbacteria bacterium]|nr:hypothetical protein [Candidatus Uhrbacteria bacterium]